MSENKAPITHLLEALPPLVVQELMACFQKLSLKKGEQLLQMGQVCRHMYLIQSGAVRHFRITKKGEEMNTWFSFENDVVSEMSSFVKQIPSTACLEAIEQTEIFAVHEHQINQLRSKFHEFETFSRKLIEEYMILTEKRAYSMQENDAIGRYNELITLNPRVEHRVSQTHIASFLGIKKETLSRIKRKNGIV